MKFLKQNENISTKTSVSWQNQILQQKRMPKLLKSPATKRITCFFLELLQFPEQYIIVSHHHSSINRRNDLIPRKAEKSSFAKRPYLFSFIACSQRMSAVL